MCDHPDYFWNTHVVTVYVENTLKNHLILNMENTVEEETHILDKMVT